MARGKSAVAVPSGQKESLKQQSPPLPAARISASRWDAVAVRQPLLRLQIKLHLRHIAALCVRVKVLTLLFVEVVNAQRPAPVLAHLVAHAHIGGEELADVLVGITIHIRII